LTVVVVVVEQKQPLQQQLLNGDEDDDHDDMAQVKTMLQRDPEATKTTTLTNYRRHFQRLQPRNKARKQPRQRPTSTATKCWPPPLQHYRPENEHADDEVDAVGDDADVDDARAN
jgi:hypothetical protein